MKVIQILGGLTIIGGLSWWWWSSRTKIPVLPERKHRKNHYAGLAEQSTYIDPPASQTAVKPQIALGTSCPNVATVEEYNSYARTLGLPLFADELPTNAPDDPRNQEFATLVSTLKTITGCLGVENQRNTSTDPPSDWANQSSSYK